MAPTPAGSFTLPVITMDKDGTVQSDQLQALCDACTQHGFLLLSNKRPDGSYHLDPSTLQTMWAVAAALFDVPQEAKKAVSVSSSGNHRGYFSSLDHVELNQDPAALGRLRDKKEGFFFGSDTLLAPGNRVPAGCEDLKAKVEGYMESARGVCVALMKAIVSTGLLTYAKEEGLATPEDFANKYLADPVYMLKVLKYPASNGNTDAHTDYGCVTMLLSGDSGLQVHYGGSWHDVPLVPDAFVINFGDMLQMWSGGVVKSTIHRVVYNNPEGTPRYSIPFFLHPSRGSTINCGPDKPAIDSYSYVLDRFDKTYKHRGAATTATTAAAAEDADMFSDQQR